MFEMTTLTPSHVTIKALAVALDILGESGKSVVLNRLLNRFGIHLDKSNLETVLDLQDLETELSRIFGTGSKIITRLIDVQANPTCSQ